MQTVLGRSVEIATCGSDKATRSRVVLSHLYRAQRQTGVALGIAQ